MNLVEIRDGSSGSSARVAVSLGFNCFDFQAVLSDGRRVAVLDAADGFAEGGQRPSHSGIPLLFPFPNRIRGGRFSWDGTDYFLPEGEVAYEGNGNAIHGFCLDRPWRIAARSENSVTGEFQLSVDAPERRHLWPADFVLRVRYTVTGAALLSEITVSNPDQQPLPWGFGTHAYFRLPLGEGSDPGSCRLAAPVTQAWELEQCLPTGSVTGELAVPLREAPKYAGLKLDDVYTGIESGADGFACRITDPLAKLEVAQICSSDFREIVAFTPPWTTAVCLEPYTCVTDAINLQQQGIDAGWRVLAAGETWTGRIEIHLQPTD